MYTTDYNRLKDRARLFEFDDFEYIVDAAMEQVEEELGETIVTNSEGQIISTDDYPIDAHKANLRHEEITKDMLIAKVGEKVYNSVASFNADSFICDEDILCKMAATAIVEKGLIPVYDFDGARARLDLTDADGFEVDKIYQTPHRELTICFDEDYQPL